MISSWACVKLVEPIGSSQEIRTICSRSSAMDRAGSSPPQYWPFYSALAKGVRSEEDTSDLPLLMRIYYAVFYSKKIIKNVRCSFIHFNIHMTIIEVNALNTKRNN